MRCHVYADDNSISRSFDLSANLVSNQLLLKRVIEKVLIVLSPIEHELNSSKTKNMFANNLRVTFPDSFVLDGYNIKVNNSFKILDVVLDSRLKSCKFEIEVCASCYCYLSAINLSEDRCLFKLEMYQS